jgi:hypothetical protein
MDDAVTPRSIRVTGESGGTIEGKPGLDDQERRWTFVPINPWRQGGYKLVIQPTIEDLAGNNIGKPFDVDKLAAIRKRSGSSAVTLAFEIR